MVVINTKDGAALTRQLARWELAKRRQALQPARQRAVAALYAQALARNGR